MFHRYVRALALVAASALPLSGFGKDLVPIEAFARHASISMPRLSPDGEHIALRMDDDDGAHALVVFAVADMTHPLSMLRMPKYEVPAEFEWASNTRLIIEKGKQFGAIDKPVSTGEILASDIDGKHQEYIYGYETEQSTRAATRGKDRGWGFIAGMPEPANGHFYMSAQSWDDENQSSLYDVDAGHGARHLIGDIGIGGLSFMDG